MTNPQIAILNALYLAPEGFLDGRPLDRFEIEMLQDRLAAEFKRGCGVQVPFKYRVEGRVIHLSEIIWRKAA